MRSCSNVMARATTDPLSLSVRTSYRFVGMAIVIEAEEMERMAIVPSMYRTASSNPITNARGS